MFVDLDQGSWDPDPPDVGQVEQAMLAIAAHEVDEGPNGGLAPRACEIHWAGLIEMRGEVLISVALRLAEANPRSVVTINVSSWLANST